MPSDAALIAPRLNSPAFAPFKFAPVRLSGPVPTFLITNRFVTAAPANTLPKATVETPSVSEVPSGCSTVLSVGPGCTVIVALAAALVSEPLLTVYEKLSTP